ncbi:MAG: helix-turn-helix domain-containing protein [bacterium]|nr:helix-turn-helix domain-containing protein [bacterium]
MRIEPHYSPPQIAADLHVDPETVRGWIQSGELTARKLGRGHKRPRYRVALSALERFLESRETAGPKPKRRKRQKTETTDFVALMNLGVGK